MDDAVVSVGTAFSTLAGSTSSLIAIRSVTGTSVRTAREGLSRYGTLVLDIQNAPVTNTLGPHAPD